MEIREISGWDITMDASQVLDALSCFPDSPAYEEIASEYQKIHTQILGRIHPVGILGLAALPSCLETDCYKPEIPVVYGVLSVGRAMEQESSRQFREGNYVRGMLWDAAANVALFSLESRMLEVLREFCAAHQMGVYRRLEAPHDIPMEFQREAWKALELERRYGIRITGGCMLDPVKTSCQCFVLTEDKSCFQAEHDCRRCQNTTCQYRNIPN